MTLLVINTPLIAGKLAVRQFGGCGVLGQDVPASGVDGPGLLFDDVDSGDALVEFRAQVLSTTLPPQAKLFVWDDSSFSIDPACPDGTYTITYRGFAAGVQYAASVDETVVIGGAGLWLNAHLDPVVSALTFSVPPTAALSATLDDATSDLNFAGPSSPLVGEIVTAVLAALRASTIPVDVRLMNGAPITGDGTEPDPWRGVGVSPS